MIHNEIISRKNYHHECVIEIDHQMLLNLVEVYNKFERFFYHGTSISDITTHLLPPNQTQVISEKGRNKNLDKVFFTKDFDSAMIYANRSKKSNGGVPKVLKVLPESLNSMHVLNDNYGTSVYYSDKALVINERLEKLIVTIAKQKTKAEKDRNIS
jgi:hypothetical protein